LASLQQLLRFPIAIGGHSEANVHEIAVKGRSLIARDNGTDVAIRPDQHPSARRKAISVSNIPTVVDDVPAQTHSVNSHTSARLYSRCGINLITQQRPMWTLKELEEKARHGFATSERYNSAH
jgi:hypothetical protein